MLGRLFTHLLQLTVWLEMLTGLSALAVLSRHRTICSRMEVCCEHPIQLSNVYVIDASNLLSCTASMCLEMSVHNISQ